MDRIKSIVEEILGDYQGGFRSNRSTTDQIFSLRKIWKNRGNSIKVYVYYFIFMNFKKAYDSVHRPKLTKLIEATRYMPQKHGHLGQQKKQA